MGICDGGRRLVVLDLKYGKGVSVYAIYDEMDEDGLDVLDVEAALLSGQIEQTLTYPGEVKVVVMRETRSIEFAR